MTIRRSWVWQILSFSALLVAGACLGQYAFGEETKAAKKAGSAYAIHVGDKLKIEVYREKDLSGIFAVDSSGDISYPLLGEVHAEGLLLDEFKDYLKDTLGKNYLVDPQVQVTFEESPDKSISIFGQVAKPGNYVLAPNTSMMRLISQVGGFAQSALADHVRVSRVGPDGKRTFMDVNMSKVMNGEAEDILLEPGDTIFVDSQETSRDRVSILGQVSRPGKHARTADLTLIGLVSQAGGFTKEAATNSVRIVRQEKGRDTSYAVDVDAIMGGNARDWPLQANDVVYVDKGLSIASAVSLLGQVSKPGNYDLLANLTLVRLVSQAGGFTTVAAPNRIRIVRLDKDGKTKTLYVDAARILGGRDKDFPLQAGDLIVVPEAYF